jgi:hypothetical protein
LKKFRFKFTKNITRNSLMVAACLLASLPLIAGKPKTPPAPPAKVVDEGTFSVIVNGSRVATETFSIKQNAQGSVSKSQLKVEDKPTQDCEMTMSANGNLIRYEWNDLMPPKGKNVVEPSNDFLVEHYARPDGKIGDQPFLMPSSSIILEDAFFSHRELLLWRYFGTSCAKSAGKACEFAKTQFGVVIPRQRISSMVTVEYLGPDKVDFKGTNRELTKLRIITEGPDWFAWVDENYKLQKISVPEDGTEVTRD